MAEYDGAELEINGGTVTETKYYEVIDNGNGDRYLAKDENGNYIQDGYTEVHAEKGGKVTVTNAELNTGVSAYGNDSVVTVNNSSIKTQGSIFAGVGGKIYLNGNENTVYSAPNGKLSLKSLYANDCKNLRDRQHRLRHAKKKRTTSDFRS